MSSTIHEDVQAGYISEEDAFVAAYLSEEVDEDAQNEPSEAPEVERDNGDRDPADDQDRDEKDEDPDQDDEQEDDADEGKPTEAPVATDDARVTVKINGEEVTTTVAELKRLYGQDKALTQKAQTLAEERRVAAEQRSQYEAGLKQMAAQAEHRWNQYNQLDLVGLRDKMDPDSYKALLADALEAKQHHEYMSQSFDQYREARANEMAKARTQAEEALNEALTDAGSPHYLPDYTPEVRQDLVAFAVNHGVEKAAAEATLDPAAIRILWMAKQYEALKEKATARRTQAVKTAPKKTLRSSGTPDGVDARRSKSRDTVVARARKSGRQEDVVAAFMADWGSDD